MSGFKKAERKQIFLKLAITGPSGSGKTFSALRLATGLGKNKKIAVIDTENGSASLYSDRFEFDVLEIGPPYSVEKYIKAMQDAVNEKYDVLIVDSITHQWKGEGGILNKKEQMDARGGNGFTNWAKLTPEQEKFVATLLHSKIDLIATIRSKQEYAMATDDKGKAKVQKLGMAPIQREGMEYEFTTVFDVAMNHEAETSKDRTGLFADKIFQITEETGTTLDKWRSSGAPMPQPAPQESVSAQESKSTTKQPAQATNPKPVETAPVSSSPQSPSAPQSKAENYLIRFGRAYKGKHMKELDNAKLRAWHEQLCKVEDSKLKPEEKSLFIETLHVVETLMVERGLNKPVEDDVPHSWDPPKEEEATV